MNTKRCITLGLDLDGTLTRFSSSPFACQMGPTAFLSFLEVHTGYASEGVSSLERIASCISVLRAHEDEMSFYRPSWNTAPFAVARTLLSYIDDWYISGWDGSSEGFGESDWLEELALLASYASLSVAPGIGQRLSRIRKALASGIHVPVDTIELVDSLDEWPGAWRQVISLLPFTERKSARVTSFPGKPGQLDISVYSYDNPISAARYIAHTGIALGSRDVLLAENEAVILDEAFFNSGKPRPGSKTGSSARSSISAATSQILPLALALQKKNVPLKLVLEFFVSPVCPLESVSYFFAKAISSSGGRKGKDWDAALEKAQERFLKQGEDPDQIAVLLEQWIPSDGSDGDEIDRERVIRTAEKVAFFLQKKSRSSKLADTYNTENLCAVARSCMLFIHTMKLLGPSFTMVPWGLVDQFVELALNQFCTDIPARREVYSPYTLSGPGQLLDSCDTLVWFCPAVPPSANPDIWNKREKELLAKNGCTFISLTEMNSAYLRKMRRTLNLIEKRLVVFLPSVSVEATPLQIELESFKLIDENRILPVENEIFDGKLSGTLQTSCRPLPGYTRWWHLPFSMSPRAEGKKEWLASHSQLEKFIKRPAEWVLSYSAGIKEGASLSVPTEPLFRGTCAHLMVERLFEKFGDRGILLSPEEFTEWFFPALNLALEECAAPYLEEEYSLEVIKYKIVLERSILRLCEFLKSIGAKNIRSEVDLKGILNDIPIRGSADLVFDAADGRSGLIDLKYAHKSDDYIKWKLNDTDTQLILYTEILKQMNGTVSESAYWLFPVQKIISRKGKLFQDSIGSIEFPLDHKTRVARLVNSIEWRDNQLADGYVEAVCENTYCLDEPVETSLQQEPPENAIPKEREKPSKKQKVAGEQGSLSKPAKDFYDPYLTLYGWRANI